MNVAFITGTVSITYFKCIFAILLKSKRDHLIICIIFKIIIIFEVLFRNSNSAVVFEDLNLNVLFKIVVFCNLDGSGSLLIKETLVSN